MRDKTLKYLADKMEKLNRSSVRYTNRLKPIISDENNYVDIDLNSNGRVSRRNFLKMLGLGAGGIFATSLGVGYLNDVDLPSKSRITGMQTGSQTGETGSSNGRFTWDQTFTDTSWLTEADENGNLNVEVVESTEWSELEDACSKSEPTVVVFEVGGVWDLDGGSLDTSSETWIAGETAPYPGVSLIKGRLRPKSPNVIVSHLGVYLGTESGRGGEDAMNADADNQLYDHITAAWSIDEAAGVPDDHEQVSFINSLVLEPLYDARHLRDDGEYHSRAFHINNDGADDLCLMGTLIAQSNRRHPFTRSPLCMVSNYLYNHTGGDENGGNIIKLRSDPQRATAQSIYLEAGEDSETDEPVLDGPCSAVYYDDIQAPAGNPITEDRQTIVDDPPIKPDGLSLPDDAIPANELKDWMRANAGPRPANRAPVEKRFFENRFGPDPNGLVDSQDEVGGYPDYSSSGPEPRNPPDTGIVDWIKNNFTAAVEPNGSQTGSQLDIQSHELTIAPNSSEKAFYLIETNGVIEKMSSNGATENQSDAVFGNKATGTVKNEKDAYNIKGVLKDFLVSGDVQLTYDGDSVTVDELKQICNQN